MLRAQSCTILAENPTAIGDAQLQQFQTSSKILEYLLQSSSIMIVDDDSVEEIARFVENFDESSRKKVWEHNEEKVSDLEIMPS